MAYDVYYYGEIAVSPPLSKEHALFLRNLFDLTDTPATRKFLKGIAQSGTLDVPYYGSLLTVSEDGARLLPVEGESRHGLRLWLEHTAAHFFGPHGYSLDGQITFDGEEADDRGTIYAKGLAVELAPIIASDPGPAWAPRSFLHPGHRSALHALLDSADTTGCTPDLTVVSTEHLNALRAVLGPQ